MSRGRDSRNKQDRKRLQLMKKREEAKNAVGDILKFHTYTKIEKKKCLTGEYATERSRNGVTSLNGRLKTVGEEELRYIRLAPEKI